MRQHRYRGGAIQKESASPIRARIDLLRLCLSLSLFQIVGGWSPTASAAPHLVRMRVDLGGRDNADRRTVGLTRCSRSVCCWASARRDVPDRDPRDAELDDPGDARLRPGLTHSFARLGNAVTPPLVAALMGPSPGAALRRDRPIRGVWVIVWVWYFCDDPRDHVRSRGRTRRAAAEPKGQRPRCPGGTAARVWPVTFTYFCYGWFCGLSQLGATVLQEQLQSRNQQIRAVRLGRVLGGRRRRYLGRNHVRPELSSDRKSVSRGSA